MEFTSLLIQIFTIVLGCFAALMSVPVLVRFQWPAPVLWIIKLFASALSPCFALLGLLSVVVGLTIGSVYLSLIGIYVTLFFLVHIYMITRPPDSSIGLEQAFGLNWKRAVRADFDHIPRFYQNSSFSTIPGTDRQLVCDIWQANASVAPSGLAFIYLHGSAWSLLDKDVGTRPFFRKLAAHGHVIMDVAYRLAPETDMMGMINDVKRAIDWMKENAATYGVNPNLIVLGGGSAGGHLALMAGYTASNPQFTPEELEGKDLSVCGIVSLYGPTDLEAMYYHTNQQYTTRSNSGGPKKAVSFQLPKWLIKKMGKAYYRFNFDKDFANAGVFASLLAGHPDECPEQYALFSPVTHVNANCPATLLIQGEHDLMVPVKATRFLGSRLTEEQVPIVMHILPQTDHAFDLILPKLSPSAHTAIYDVQQFLAMQCQN